jgi:uncharacterized damage-inducible protein DinB
MTHADLTNLVDYHYWARDRLLDALDPLTPEQFTRDLGNSFKSIRDTVAHLHAAEWAWHSRWVGVQPTALLPHDRFSDVAGVRHAWAESERDVRGFIERLGDDIGRTFEYKLLSGAVGASPFWQMVQHVVNHASYHRGQITTMLRQIGAQPGKPMDMIAYYRTKNSELRT